MVSRFLSGFCLFDFG